MSSNTTGQNTVWKDVPYRKKEKSLCDDFVLSKLCQYSRLEKTSYNSKSKFSPINRSGSWMITSGWELIVSWSPAEINLTH